jgi:hypothetical protein
MRIGREYFGNDGFSVAAITLGTWKEATRPPRLHKSHDSFLGRRLPICPLASLAPRKQWMLEGRLGGATYAALMPKNQPPI